MSLENNSSGIVGLLSGRVRLSPSCGYKTKEQKMIYIASKVKCIDEYCKEYKDIGEVVSIENYSVTVSFPPNPSKYPKDSLSHSNYHEVTFMSWQLEFVPE